jgi:quercetin dioxygenase-like cupin family protein
MKYLAVLLSLILIGFSSQAQTPVPVTREPFHHLRVENSIVKIFDVKVPPWKATLFHIHPEDYVFATLGDSTLKSQVLGQKEEDLILKSGEVRFKAGPITHRVRNLAGKPFHNITIELLRPPAGGAANSPEPPLGRHQEITLENDRVRVTRTILRPGESTGQHSHKRPDVVVVIRGGTLLDRMEGKGMEGRSIRAGSFAWREGAVTHSISNTGRRVIELIDIEIK